MPNTSCHRSAPVYLIGPCYGSLKYYLFLLSQIVCSEYSLTMYELIHLPFKHFLNGEAFPLDSEMEKDPLTLLKAQPLHTAWWNEQPIIVWCQHREKILSSSAEEENNPQDICIPKKKPSCMCFINNLERKSETCHLGFCAVHCRAVFLVVQVWSSLFSERIPDQGSRPRTRHPDKTYPPSGENTWDWAERSVKRTKWVLSPNWKLSFYF